MKERHRVKREAKRSLADAERAVLWTPPERSCLDSVDLISFHPTDDFRLTIEVRLWTLNGRIADFYAAVMWGEVESFSAPKKIASADCRHHGSIHFHDEIAFPDHEQFEPFAPLRSINDVTDYYDRAIEALIDFADTIIHREEMAR